MGLLPLDPHKGAFKINLKLSFYQNPLDIYWCLPVLSILLDYIFSNSKMFFLII